MQEKNKKRKAGNFARCPHFRGEGKRLRKAVLTDIFEIYSLIDFASKREKILLRSKEEIEKVLDSFWVWEENQKVVGCCSLEIYSPKIAEIRSLVVLPEYQNRGIGTNLVKACLSEAKSKGIYEVLAITDQEKFFKKIGFRQCLGGQYAMFQRP